MQEDTTQKRTEKTKGWLIAGMSLAVLFGIIILKAEADTAGDSDLD